MEEFCLDRACEAHAWGAHFKHEKFGEISYVTKHDPRLNSQLEESKRRRGYRCVECSRFLLPSDEDHTFCEDCWHKLLAHSFVPTEEGLCDDCGEPRNHDLHQNL